MLSRGRPRGHLLFHQSQIAIFEFILAPQNIRLFFGALEYFFFERRNKAFESFLRVCDCFLLDRNTRIFYVILSLKESEVDFAGIIGAWFPRFRRCLVVVFLKLPFLLLNSIATASSRPKHSPGCGMTHSLVKVSVTLTGGRSLGSSVTPF